MKKSATPLASVSIFYAEMTSEIWSSHWLIVLLNNLNGWLHSLAESMAEPFGWA